jgi:hypothetical protein
MKKLVVCLAAVAVLACTVSVSAQTKSNMLSTNPLGMIFGIFNLEYQKGIGEKDAIGISAMYWKPPLIDLSIIGASISYNIYFKSTFHGFFIKPSVSIGFASWKFTTIDMTSSSFGTKTEDKTAMDFGLGAIAGYRWLWNGGFSIGLGGGMTYTFGSFEGIDFGGVSPALLFDLGWAF